jgi:hypothetical protein
MLVEAMLMSLFTGASPGQVMAGLGVLVDECVSAIVDSGYATMQVSATQADAALRLADLARSEAFWGNNAEAHAASAKAYSEGQIAMLAEVRAHVEQVGQLQAYTDQANAEASYEASLGFWSGAHALLLRAAELGIGLGRDSAAAWRAAGEPAMPATPSVAGGMAAAGGAAAAIRSATRRRDFTEPTRQAILSALQALVDEAPFNHTTYYWWPEFEADCKRLVPEAFDCFDGMADYHSFFVQVVRECIGEVNRCFDAAQAVNRDSAGKVKAHNDGLRRLVGDIETLALRLDAAAGKMQGIGV